MNTIALNRNVNGAFKQVQLLPALTPGMIVDAGAPQTFCPTGLTTPTRPKPARVGKCPAAAHSLPRPLADQSAGETALFAVLALSAVGALGLGLAPIIPWSASLPQFTAWVAQLLG